VLKFVLPHIYVRYLRGEFLFSLQTAESQHRRAHTPQPLKWNCNYETTLKNTPHKITQTQTLLAEYKYGTLQPCDKQSHPPAKLQWITYMTHAGNISLKRTHS